MFNIGSEVIKSEENVKILEDSHLNFEHHVSTLCKGLQVS